VQAFLVYKLYSVDSISSNRLKARCFKLKRHDFQKQRVDSLHPIRYDRAPGCIRLPSNQSMHCFYSMSCTFVHLYCI